MSPFMSRPMPQFYVSSRPPAMPAATPMPAGAAIGQVRSIMLRAATPQSVQAVQANAGLGLAGDRHADPLSPRQVLLAGAPAYARHALPRHALRENLLLDVDTAPLAPGTLLRIGADTVLRLTFRCEACRYLDAHQPGIAAAIGPARGTLARVLHGGAIRVGDPIAVLTPALPAWSDDWRERVAAILARVPDGMVVEYRQLARLAGVQAVYCRTFPRLARALGFAHVAVAAGTRPEVSRWQGTELFDETRWYSREAVVP